MSEIQPRTLALVVEADADARTVGHLVDRLLARRAFWIADGDPTHFRRHQIYHWRTIKRLAREHGVVAHGGFGEASAAPDARAARRALMVLAKLGPPDATVLMRDADNQPERRTGLEQGRADGRHGLDSQAIAIALATPSREAWHLAGFEPENEAETRALACERQRLGLDPRLHGQECGGQGKRAIKPVLASLTGGQLDREQRCLETEFEVLHERGEGSGLTAFLDEADARIVPVFA